MFTDISFSLPVSQSQVKQPHLLLPFLLLTTLLVHLVVIHFQTVLCFSCVGQSQSKSLLEEPAGQFLHAKPRLRGLSVPLSHHECVWLRLEFTPAAKEGARRCLHHHSQLSQNLPLLPLSWRAQGPCVGRYSKADLRDHLTTPASPSLQHLRHQPFLPSQGWKTSQAPPVACPSLCGTTWAFAPWLPVTQLGKYGLTGTRTPVMKWFHGPTKMCVSHRGRTPKYPRSSSPSFLHDCLLSCFSSLAINENVAFEAGCKRVIFIWIL